MYKYPKHASPLVLVMASYTENLMGFKKGHKIKFTTFQNITLFL